MPRPHRKWVGIASVVEWSQDNHTEFQVQSYYNINAVGA